MKNSRSIASILKYDEKVDLSNSVNINTNDYSKSKGVIGIIGAGNFTQMQMLPALSKTNADIKYIVSSKGVSSTTLAKKYNIANSSTNYKDLFTDADVDLVMVMTRHDSHAQMVTEALENKKHVFVEKPLALSQEDLDKIKEVYEKSEKTLTVGFNRRFSPFAVKMKQIIGNGKEPINVIATMNAGAIPKEVWVHDMEIGGGRIVGEACHFIDLISYLTGSKVTEVVMNAMGVNPQEDTDTASILLKYENGSTGVINYFANGSKLYSKERVEVYSQERTLVLDNFRELKGYGTKGFSKMKSTQDKGHNAQFKLLVEHLTKGKEALIPFDSLYNTTKASFAALESLRNNAWVKV
jgi:predicted dehydrogenase